jgi:hypothetical protein
MNPGELTWRGRAALFDPTRKRLVIATREERVRQQLLRSLHEGLGVPIEMMSTEEPLAHHRADLRTRADIVIWGPPLDDQSTRTALMVIEVKADTEPITDHTFEQALEYATELGAPMIGAANVGGIEGLRVRHLNGDGHWQSLARPPSYETMLTQAELEYDESPGEGRLTYAAVTDKDRILSLVGEVIGEDTTHAMHGFLAELDNFLLHEPFVGLPWQVGDLSIHTDCGVSDSDFENASGSGWAGLYRTLLVQVPAVGDLPFRIGMLARGKFRNHPRWGNSAGTTTLLVGVDDPELGAHASLQLTLDHHCALVDSAWHFSHDGRMAAGARGRVKNELVVNFVREKAASLVSANRVHLGAMPHGQSMLCDAGARNLISNLVHYGYLRDLVRLQLRAQ